MKRQQSLIITAIFLLFSLNSKAQSSVFSKLYKPGSILYASTASGVVLRAKPDAGATMIQVVPYGHQLVVQPNAEAPVPFTNGGIKGTWAKVKVGDKEGYAFDGYLSRFKPIELIAKDKFPPVDQYLKSLFKVKSQTDKINDATVSEYAKIVFDNNVIYESKQYEGGYTEIITLPASVYTFQEAYLLARAHYPDVIASAKCAYSEDDMTCDDEGTLSLVSIKKNGQAYIITRNSAD